MTDRGKDRKAKDVERRLETVSHEPTMERLRQKERESVDDARSSSKKD